MAAIATRSGAASFIVVALAVFLFRGLCRQRALADEAVRRRGSERRKKKENDARSCSFSRWEDLCEDEEGKKKNEKRARERRNEVFFFHVLLPLSPFFYKAFFPFLFLRNAETPSCRPSPPPC